MRFFIFLASSCRYNPPLCGGMMALEGWCRVILMTMIMMMVSGWWWSSWFLLISHHHIPYSTPSLHISHHSSYHTIILVNHATIFLIAHHRSTYHRTTPYIIPPYSIYICGGVIEGVWRCDIKCWCDIMGMVVWYIVCGSVIDAVLWCDRCSVDVW